MVLTFHLLTNWLAAVQREFLSPWRVDGVFDSPEPGGGRGGDDAPAPRYTKTELERQVAEYRRTEEALAR